MVKAISVPVASVEVAIARALVEQFASDHFCFVVRHGFRTGHWHVSVSKDFETWLSGARSLLEDIRGDGIELIDPADLGRFRRVIQEMDRVVLANPEKAAEEYRRVRQSVSPRMMGVGE